MVKQPALCDVPRQDSTELNCSIEIDIISAVEGRDSGGDRRSDEKP